MWKGSIEKVCVRRLLSQGGEGWLTPFLCARRARAVSAGGLRWSGLGACVVLALMVSADAVARTLPAPTGPVVLTVSGKIEHRNGGGKMRFDRDMLEGIGLWTLETRTPLTDGRHRFEGILARDLLIAVGATGEVVTARSINDYTIDIPITDFLKYPVLLALKKNGDYLRVRDNGPIWIIYPRDRFKELNDRRTTSKWVGQLMEFIVK